MKRIILVLVGACLLSACRPIDREILPASRELLTIADNYRIMQPDHVLELAGSDEPGTRLLVLGRLVDSLDRELPDQEIKFYHANSQGSYQESAVGDETTARIKGSIRTDSTGRFMLSTIMPAGYDGTGGGHIHMDIESAKPSAYDFYFRQYASRGLLRWANNSSQAVVLNLHTARGDTLIAISKLPVRGTE